MKKITRRVAALLCAIVLLITSASALSVEDARELLEDLYVDELPPVPTPPPHWRSCSPL